MSKKTHYKHITLAIVLNSLLILPIYSAFEYDNTVVENSFFLPASENYYRTVYINYFGLINTYIVDVSQKLRNMHFAIGIRTTGITDYRETEILYQFMIQHKGFQVGPGIKIELLSTKFGTYMDYGVDIGLIYSKDNMKFKSAIHNLKEPKFEKTEVSTRIAAQIEYCYSSVKLNLLLLKEKKFPTIVGINAKFNLNTFFGILAGVESYPPSAVLGITMNLHKMEISYRVRTHNALGITQIIDLKLLTL